MAYRLKINKRFVANTQSVYRYLAEEWSFTIADQFVEQVYVSVRKLAEMPFAGSPTSGNKNVRSISVTRHNKIYYRIKGKTITILTLFQSKMNPAKNKYE
jgi:plasmid stabilization system protein ParE